MRPCSPHVEFERQPFRIVIARSREDAKEWAAPYYCYAIDYMRQADVERFPFGTKVFRVWTTRPTSELRKHWEAE
jgi:hypothetical protein